MKVKNIVILGAVIAGMTGSLSAQLSLNIDPEDKKALLEKTNDLYKVIDPLVKDISDSVVIIKAGDDIISVGTVTSKGIVTKYSEISKYGAGDKLRMVDKNGTIYRDIELLSIYEDYDIAVLKNVGGLPAVDLTRSMTPEFGAFIVAATASEQALAMGVVSVKPRTLIEKDRGFLGVIMDMTQPEDGGVKLTSVMDDTAASNAGLKRNDIIISVDGKAVNNMFEMRNFLQKLTPGSSIKISYKRDGVITPNINVVLGSRKKTPQVKQSRMNAMKKMGGKVNDVNEGFPQVIQSDIQIKSKFCGAPVVNLDGEIVGLVIARSSRIKAYIIEGKVLDKLLQSTPDR